jgi:hypothetical protein
MNYSIYLLGSQQYRSWLSWAMLSFVSALMQINGPADLAIVDTTEPFEIANAHDLR